MHRVRLTSADCVLDVSPRTVVASLSDQAVTGGSPRLNACYSVLNVGGGLPSVEQLVDAGTLSDSALPVRLTWPPVTRRGDFGRVAQVVSYADTGVLTNL